MYTFTPALPALAQAQAYQDGQNACLGALLDEASESDGGGGDMFGTCTGAVPSSCWRAESQSRRNTTNERGGVHPLLGAITLQICSHSA